MRRSKQVRERHGPVAGKQLVTVVISAPAIFKGVEAGRAKVKASLEREKNDLVIEKIQGERHAPTLNRIRT
jgi:hypothetical protein